MRNRILPIVNVLLILVCAGCVWYLTTDASRYQRPREIADAEKYLAGITPTPTPLRPGDETKFNPNQVTAAVTPVPTAAGTPPAMMNKSAFAPIWTPTPTPTPTPSPTPAPPDLRSAVEAWEITSIDGNKVEFLDRRAPNGGETFTLELNGPPRETVDGQNRSLAVNVIAVDLDNNKVTLGYMDQKFEKSMF